MKAQLLENFIILGIAVTVSVIYGLYENFVSDYPAHGTLLPFTLNQDIPYGHWPWYPWLYGTFPPYPPLVLR